MRQNFLADRYMQICQNKECQSSDLKTDLWKGIFTYSDIPSPPVAKTSELDSRLEKLLLVVRYEKEGKWMVKRRRGYPNLYSWITYLSCKLMLIYLLGDTQSPK